MKKKTKAKRVNIHTLPKKKKEEIINKRKARKTILQRNRRAERKTPKKTKTVKAAKAPVSIKTAISKYLKPFMDKQARDLKQFTVQQEKERKVFISELKKQVNEIL